jgi:hypothetical protein
LIVVLIVVVVVCRKGDDGNANDLLVGLDEDVGGGVADSDEGSDDAGQGKGTNL